MVYNCITIEYIKLQPVRTVHKHQGCRKIENLEIPEIPGNPEKIQGSQEIEEIRGLGSSRGVCSLDVCQQLFKQAMPASWRRVGPFPDAPGPKYVGRPDPGLRPRTPAETKNGTV